MRRSSPLHRFARYRWRDYAMLAEALVVLAAASAAIRLLAFRQVAAVAGSWGSDKRPGSSVDDAKIRKLVWAVDAWGRRVPWKAVCFQRGLALHLMLRRRGCASILHYGVSRGRPQGLGAHVWVTANGLMLAGGKEAPDFICLATFPGSVRTSADR